MGREAVDGTTIGVDDFGGVGRGGREGSNDGCIPIIVRGEKGRLVRFGDMNDEGLIMVKRRLEG